MVGGVPPFTLWSIREVGGRSKALWSSHYSNTWAGGVKGEERTEGVDQKSYKNRSLNHPRAAEFFLHPARRRSVRLELSESEAEREGEEKRNGEARD